MNKIFLILVLLFILSFGLIYYFKAKNINYFIIEKDSINKIVVEKSKRVMSLYQDDKLITTYQIALGKNPIGHKEFEGDKKTPEGIYIINSKNPNSGWHKNLGISYPNEEDIKNAQKNGKPAGGDIKIHALRNGFGFIDSFHRNFDWTNGCIAVTNEEIDQLYHAVKIGAVIEIYP